MKHIKRFKLFEEATDTEIGNYNPINESLELASLAKKL
jgi:hypothetical protein